MAEVIHQPHIRRMQSTYLLRVTGAPKLKRTHERVDIAVSL